MVFFKFIFMNLKPTESEVTYEHEHTHITSHNIEIFTD